VVDFLDFQFGSYHWPAFNVADSCICVAAGLLLISGFSSGGAEAKKGS
jgi:signal peptidase II